MRLSLMLSPVISGSVPMATNSSPDRVAQTRAAFDKVIGRVLHRADFESRLNKVAFVGVSQGAITALDAVGSG